MKLKCVSLTLSLTATKRMEYRTEICYNASKLGISADKVYEALAEKSDILNSYIIPEYGILHTQSKEYIVSDIIDVMKERGVQV